MVQIFQTSNPLDDYCRDVDRFFMETSPPDNGCVVYCNIWMNIADVTTVMPSTCFSSVR